MRDRYQYIIKRLTFGIVDTVESSFLGKSRSEFLIFPVHLKPSVYRFKRFPKQINIRSNKSGTWTSDFAGKNDPSRAHIGIVLVSKALFSQGQQVGHMDVRFRR